MEQDRHDTNNMLTWYSVALAILPRVVISVLTWSAIILVLLWWNAGNLDIRSDELAVAQARAHWTKNKALQDWVSRHGGVYVKSIDLTTPSPFLDFLPERNIETKDGAKLTLLNPAYAIREMMQDYEQRYGVKGSITGKVLINPDNKPDAWQLAVLERFEKESIDEVFEQLSIDGSAYMRYMKPLYMQEACMQCHGRLGFKVGDLRGGLGVDVPMQPILDSASASRTDMYVSAVFLWLLGLFVILMLLSIAHKRALLHKAYQTQLQQDHNLLEQRVKERTRELQLAKENADNASLAKSQFLSRMSHELRTPLNAILGFARLMKMDAAKQQVSDDHRTSLDEILRAGDHLLELINEVLDLSHIESGKLEASLINMDVQDIIDNCVSLMRPHANARKITIKNRVRTQGCQINVDSKFLRQILMNLLSNAIKYNRENGEVSVSIERHSDTQCKLVVEDTGEGIPREMQERLFEPFDRLGKGDEEEGSGIGLAVCQGLVALMGGEIGVESKLGKGTQFWVLLRLAK